MITKNLIQIFLVVLVGCAGAGVNAKVCSSSNFWEKTICREDQFCCGTGCCNTWSSDSGYITLPGQNTHTVYSSSSDGQMEGFLVLLCILFFIICCPICCYRCCCKKTTNQGRVYNPTGNVPSSVTISLPPSQAGQQVPYPTVVPYPQQTPYPPQHATNPFYNMPMPPPTYAQTVEAGRQQQGIQQSPSAPPLMTM